MKRKHIKRFLDLRKNFSLLRNKVKVKLDMGVVALPVTLLIKKMTREIKTQCKETMAIIIIH